MKKQVVTRLIATALAAVLAAPVGGLTVAPASITVKAAENTQAAEKTAPRVTAVSESEASSWSPAVMTLEGISQYDDAQKAWLNKITVKVNGESYTHADYDSLETGDTKKYAFSYKGIQLTVTDLKEGDNEIELTADGYKKKVIVVTRTKKDDQMETIMKSQKDGNDEVDLNSPDTSALSNAIIDAKALEKGDKTDEKWNALQEAIKTAEEALANVSSADDVSSALSALKQAVKLFQKDTKGPEVKSVKYNSDAKRIYFPEIYKYDDDAKDYIDQIKEVTVNGNVYTHTDGDYFDSDDADVASKYGFTYYGMELGDKSLVSGKNEVKIQAEGYDDKYITFTKNGDTFTFESQADGKKEETPDDNKGIQDPKEDGVYTLAFEAKETGKDSESMIQGVFDPNVKLTVENGKMKLSFLNTSLKDYFLDYSVSSGDTFKEAVRQDWGEPDKNKEYTMQEFTIDIDTLTGAHQAAALVTAMGGQKSDIHNWDKYTKADLTFTNITKGWNGYQQEQKKDDQDGKKALIDALVAGGYDTDGDGTISDEELAAISGELNLSNKNLTDISFLKGLSDKVTTLDLSNNKIKEIPEGLLDKLTNLTDFYIEDNELTEIPKNLFKNNKKLYWTTFAANELTSIEAGEVSDLPNLAILDLESNNITKVSKDAFRGLTGMEQLSLGENLLASLPDGCFEDPGKSATFLSLEGNMFGKLPNAVMDMTKLTKLYAFSNELYDISNIDFTKFADLEVLDLHFNEISKLPAKGFSANKKLQSLDLYDNCLTALDTSMLPAGVTLHKLDVRLNNMNVIDPKLRDHAKSFNKFTPQKTAVKMKLSADGTNGLKWTQDLKGLDLVFWADETNSDRTEELTSTDAYREMLKTNGWADKKIEDVLNDQGYDWDIVTVVQKKQADGSYKTVYENTQSDEEEAISGTYKTSEPGTYRVAKQIYTLTSGTVAAYRTTVFSNDYVYGTQAKVTAPSSVKAVSTAYNRAKISWKKVTGASGYEVYEYNTKKKTYKKVKTVKGTSLEIKGLKTGTKYTYAVRAYKNADGKKAYSTYSKKIAVTPVPAAPASVKAKNVSKKSVKLTWKKVSGANGYRVYVKGKNGKYKTLKTVKGTSYTIRGLKKGSGYSYKVKAYRNVGKKKVLGAYSKTTSVKIKK